MFRAIDVVTERYDARTRLQADFQLKTLFATFYFGTKRRQDIDNFNKLVLDACSSLVWTDGSQIEELILRKDYDKKNPRVEISIATADCPS